MSSLCFSFENFEDTLEYCGRGQTYVVEQWPYTFNKALLRVNTKVAAISCITKRLFKRRMMFSCYFSLQSLNS